MNAFIKTLLIGFAALGVILLVGGVTALAKLRGNGTLDPGKLRQVLLTPEEQAWLGTMHARPEEHAEAPERAESEQQMLDRLAELVSADQAQRLVAALRHQKQALDERQVWLDQQEAEMRLARADLQRLRGQFDERATALAAEGERQRAEHARWAEAAAAETRQVDVLRQVELERAKEQVKIFEAMKEGAWQSLRRFPPREIARYLYLMDPKRAAKLLAVAEADQEFPDITLAIHRAYLALDASGLSGDRIAHLAQLYTFLPAASVANSLRDSPAQEAAELINAMGDAKRQADVLAAIRSADPLREAELQRLIAQLAKPAAQ
jgi:hypothetical protein